MYVCERARESKPSGEGAMLLETHLIPVAEGPHGSVKAQGQFGNSQCEMIPWSNHSCQGKNEIIWG